MTDEDLLGVAVELVRDASRLAAQRYLEGPQVSTKADGTEVTTADIEIEERIRSQIAARFPRDGVFGEEHGETTGSSGRRWVLDPIDGTAYFAHRIPTFEILLAVEQDGEGVVSVIGHPMSQEIFYAACGLGSWYQAADGPPRRIAVSDRRRRRGAWVVMVNPASWSEEFLLALHREVMLTSNAKGTSGVACGLTDAMICAGFPMGYEDIAPMQVLVTEAGGRVTDLGGHDVRTGDGSVLASNGHLHDQLLELVQDLPHVRDYRALMSPQ